MAKNTAEQKGPNPGSSHLKAVENPQGNQPHNAENTAHPHKGHSTHIEHPKKHRHEPIEGACFAVGCKSKPLRLNFCEEHFEQFKFGLINKSGELVPDHEKKFEHYMVFRQKLSARKAA